MDAKTVREKGQKVGDGKYAGTIWSYNNSLWIIFGGKDNFAYCWGKT